MTAGDLLRRYGPRVFGELAIIIAGVSAALWFQSLKDRRDALREERRYLVELEADFRTNVELLEQVQKAERQGEEAAIAVLGAVHDRGVVSNPDSVKVWFARATRNGGRPALAQGTFVAMIETGSLGLIRDRSLRSLLAAFASQLSSDLQVMDYWADAAFHTLVNNTYFKREVGVFELYSDEERQSRGLPMSNQFPIDVNRLVSEKEFGGLATDTYLMRRIRRQAVERLLRASQAVLNDLNRVLEEGT